MTGFFDLDSGLTPTLLVLMGMNIVFVMDFGRERNLFLVIMSIIFATISLVWSIKRWDQLIHEFRKVKGEE